MVTESDPPCLPYLLQAISSPSVGVRAAACQLTRALSRTVSLVRTSLIDCGISDAVIDILVWEVDSRNIRDLQAGREDVGDESEQEEIWGNRSYTVEITAMMTLCNLIADFSPLKEVSRNAIHQGQITDYSETPSWSRHLHDMQLDTLTE